MKGDPVPIENHISRYCSASRLTEEGQVTGTAFQLRETDEYLSVNWLEFLQQANRQDEIQEVRRVLNSKLTLTANAKIAVLNVGDILNHVRIMSPDTRNLSVLHEPIEDDSVVNDPSHSGIYGFRYDNHLIADLIVEVVQETYPAREP
jgi:hypothetical protein